MRTREIPRSGEASDFVRERWPAAQARADAIVAAQRRRDDECDALRDRLGLPQIEESLDDAYEAM